MNQSHIVAYIDDLNEWVNWLRRLQAEHSDVNRDPCKLLQQVRILWNQFFG